MDQNRNAGERYVRKDFESPVIIYEEAGRAVEVRLDPDQETVWLSLNQLGEVFGRDKSVISRHLKNIFESNELERGSVVAKRATTAADGKTYQVEFYNLDAIISVGYRVNSIQATRFRARFTDHTSCRAPTA
jgi:hypothetical protein